MSDDQQNPDGEADSTASDVARGVQAGAQATQGAVGAVTAASSGNVAGTVAGLAVATGAVAGAAGGEAGQAVQAGAQVVGAGAQLVGAGQQLANASDAGAAAQGIGSAAGAAGTVAGLAGGEAGQAVQTGTQAVQTGAQLAGGAQQLGNAASSGDVGRAAQGLGSGAAGASSLVQDQGARQALGTGGQALGTAGQALGSSRSSSGSSPASPPGPESRRVDVEIHLEIDSLEARWGVRHVELHEEMSRLYECSVHARCDTQPEISDLLAKSAHVKIVRGEQMRSVHGIVRHAQVSELEDGALVELSIVPAMWLLEQNMRSRVWTNKTIPEVVEAIYQERLGDWGRKVQNDLTRTYPVHELLVQHQETDLAFVQRRLEQEGIFTYFVHEGTHEVLVLADVTSGLANAREDDGGRVPWCDEQRPGPDGEGIFDAVHFEELGATDVVVTEYNWTAPESPPVRGTATGRGDLDPPLEIYDHTDAVTLHGYSSPSYPQNDAADQARMRAEILELSRKRWSLSALVVAAQPGHIIELTGCPDGALDGRYVIVAVSAEGSATEGIEGTYRAQLRVIPHAVPFRPARRTPVPVISGFQSAMVVGPSDHEIHTDEHGRVQIRFPWDREHEPSAHDECSCWVRVMHAWAGPGFGTTFIPRIGMEVVVTFLYGNPDQPLVIGCLYHGTHPSPVATPDDKTQSAIRTKSSMNSEGFNELRFEDKAGHEFIYTHAQKDYNEEVENNHSTHVKNNQSNTVDANQTETVGGNQTMTVHKKRTKTVDEDEENTVHQNRTTRVDKNDEESVGGDRTLHVEGNETITIDLDRKLHVVKKTVQNHDDGRVITVLTKDHLVVDGGADRKVKVSGEYHTLVAGAKYVLEQATTEKFVQESPKTYLESADEVHVKVGPSHVQVKADGTVTIKTSSSVLLGVEGSKLEIKPGSIAMESSEIQLKAGESLLKLEASKATLKGAMVDLLADMFATIKGTLVRIN
ncbi:MAG: type VI secretion system tip protein VgrG [Sandaracinaceae bacterium]|nr:type VI secretion system tip protein VgrG [Sandaracinaceae bacterium]